MEEELEDTMEDADIQTPSGTMSDDEDADDDEEEDA